jgi:CRP/FNR family transcriptional regulator, cyclic AMP receptor protein
VSAPVPRSVEFPVGQVAERLGQVAILESLSQRQLKKLAEWVKILSYADGEKIVKRGDGGIGLFLILDGAAEVRRGNRGLATLGVGQFFGEMSLFDDKPRSADVVATKPSKVAVLSKWEFWGFAEKEPKVLRGVLEEMSRRLRETDQALSE